MSENMLYGVDLKIKKRKWNVRHCDCNDKTCPDYHLNVGPEGPWRKDEAILVASAPAMQQAIYRFLQIENAERMTGESLSTAKAFAITELREALTLSVKGTKE
jgi:hypothetical protein